MRYIIIIILSLSLPATALVSTVAKNNPDEVKTTVAPNKSKKKTEELRKIIQKKASKPCNPKEETRMPTFY